MSTNSNSPTGPGNRIWGIYHTDREFAREVGDPLRATVEAPTKEAAEQEAARLGFNDPWAHPVDSEQAKQAQWLEERKPTHRKANARKQSHGISI